MFEASLPGIVNNLERLLDDRRPSREEPISIRESPRYLNQLENNVFTVNTPDYTVPTSDLSLYNQALDRSVELMNHYASSEMIGTSYDFRGRAEATLDAYVQAQSSGEYCSGCSSD